MILEGCGRAPEPAVASPPAGSARASVPAQEAQPQRTRINRAPDTSPATATPARAPAESIAAGPAATAATVATSGAAALDTPAPRAVADTATTPGETLQRIRSAISALNPITQPRLSPEAEQAIQADLRKLIADAETPGAHPKEAREGITIYADKVQFQLEQARAATNPDEYIRHLARCQALLAEIDPLLEQK
jgi:hypothetical protein